MIFLFTLAIWFIVYLYKYYYFGFYDWDLAFFAQAMWQISHGEQYVSLFNNNFLGNHANLIAYVLIPLYKIFATPLTLLFLKALSFAVSAQLLFDLACERLGRKWAWVIFGIYLLYVPNILGMLYEFDFESLAPGLLMVMMLAFLKQRKGVFSIAAVVVVLIKENMPLIVLMFAVLGFFQGKNKKYWVWVGVSAVIVFLFLSFVLVPHFANRPMGQHPYGMYYGGILESITHDSWWQRRVIWINQLLGPLLFCPLLGISALVPVSAIFFQHVLSKSWQQQSLYFAYMLTLIPFIFVALILGLDQLKKRFKYCFIVVVIAMGIFGIFNVIQAKEAISLRFLTEKHFELVSAKEKIMSLIPPHAAVVAEFSFLSHLTDRRELYAFYKMYSPIFQNETYQYELPQHVKYAVIDYGDDWFEHYYRENPERVKKCIEVFLAQGWKPVVKINQLILYQR